MAARKNKIVKNKQQ